MPVSLIDEGLPHTGVREFLVFRNLIVQLHFFANLRLLFQCRKCGFISEGAWHGNRRVYGAVGLCWNTLGVDSNLGGKMAITRYRNRRIETGRIKNGTDFDSGILYPIHLFVSEIHYTLFVPANRITIPISGISLPTPSNNFWKLKQKCSWQSPQAKHRNQRYPSCSRSGSDGPRQPC